MKRVALIAAAALALLGPLGAAHADEHARSAVRGAVWFGHHRSFGHDFGHGRVVPARVRTRIYLGFGPYWDPFWYPYPYRPYSYYPYSYYSSPPVVVTPPSTTYIQPQSPPQPEHYWYYCTSPKGYYPYVKECPPGWMKVVPQAPPGQ